MASALTYGERFDSGEPLAEAFSLMVDLHTALGEAPVSDRVWSHDVDHRWTIHVNGAGATRTVLVGEATLDIPALHVLVIYNGWVAGLFDMFGGAIAAGTAANEDAFIEVMRAAIERAKLREEPT